MKWVAISVTAVLLAAASGYGWAQSPMKSPQTEGAQATGAAVKAKARPRRQVPLRNGRLMKKR